MSTKGTHIPDWLQVPFAGITPAPTQQKGQDLFPTGNWRAIRPVYRDKMPPCNNACGTNEKIQGYLDLVKRGKYLDAYALIKEDMPFPSVTGRVCYHPCEQACNRGQYDEAISIRAVERFLGDLGQALPKDVVKAGAPNGKKVAVVGSGPAGHSAAYQLARLGYAVTILERSPKAGGLNRGGIPDWVLPQDVLDRQIQRPVELGPLEQADEIALVRDLIRRHVEHTRSPYAARILDDWGGQQSRFVRVMPKDYQRVLLAEARAKAEGREPTFAELVGSTSG